MTAPSPCAPRSRVSSVTRSGRAGDTHDSRAAVITACDASAAYLVGVGTTFTSSRTIVGTDTVVVETTADYVEGDETSSVSSCDLYDVVDGKITVITSYAVEH